MYNRNSASKFLLENCRISSRSILIDILDNILVTRINNHESEHQDLLLLI